MADPIRDALERAARELELVAGSLTQAGWAAAASRARDEAHAARAALDAQPPEQVLTFLDAIRLANGCHDYSSGGHVGESIEAFHAGIGTVVEVLKKAAAGPWDHQTSAVFAAGSEPIAQSPAPAPAPAAVPVAVADRPWEREGWCNAEGRCWYHNGSSVVCNSRWYLIRPDVDFLVGDDGWLLPHWAIPLPQPPQGGEVE